MTGTITKYKLKNRKTSWGYYFLAGRAANGKRIQVKQQGFETKRDAEDALRRAVEASSRELRPNDSRTFTAVFDHWLDDHACRRCERKTVARYRELGAYAVREFG